MPAPNAELCWLQEPGPAPSCGAVLHGTAARGTATSCAWELVSDSSSSSQWCKMLLNRLGNGSLGNKTPCDLESVPETPPSVKQIKQYLPRRPFYFLPVEQ